MRNKILEFWFDDSELASHGRYTVKLKRLDGVTENNASTFSNYDRWPQKRKSRWGSYRFSNNARWLSGEFTLTYHHGNDGTNGISLAPESLYRLHHVIMEQWPAFKDCVKKYNMKHSAKYDNISMGSLIVKRPGLASTGDKKCK